MLKVGLTGGIGAGKSAVSRMLAERGAIIIDADVLAREVVAGGTDGFAAVVEAFGDGVVGADGELDRPALGARVFADATARERLEKIIHPRVRARSAELVAAAPAGSIVVNDVPLLVETGLAPTYHLVIVVEAAAPTRIARLVATRGMSEEQATARIAAQAGDEQRRAAADVVIVNEGTPAELSAQVARLWQERLRPYEHNVRFSRHAPAGTLLRVVPPDPAWPAQAARIMARIGHALRPAAFARGLAHIGPTAVPGLPAKDVVDRMLGVPTLAAADQVERALAGAGLPRRDGEWFDNARGVPGATWPKRLHGNADPGRPVNLHVRVTGSPGWRFALLLRDHLRAVPEAREGYTAALGPVGTSGHGDPLGYADALGAADGRESWFDEEYLAAYAWAEQTGWRPAA